jgi:hypothetical protein
MRSNISHMHRILQRRSFASKRNLGSANSMNRLNCSNIYCLAWRGDKLLVLGLMVEYVPNSDLDWALVNRWRRTELSVVSVEGMCAIVDLWVDRRTFDSPRIRQDAPLFTSIKPATGFDASITHRKSPDTSGPKNLVGRRWTCHQVCSCSFICTAPPLMLAKRG